MPEFKPNVLVTVDGCGACAKAKRDNAAKIAAGEMRVIDIEEAFDKLIGFYDCMETKVGVAGAPVYLMVNDKNEVTFCSLDPHKASQA